MTEIKDHLTHLGGITYYFQHLEAVVSLLFSSLIHNDQKIGQIVTSQLSFQRMLTALDSVFRHQVSDEALVSEFAALIVDASQAEETRNKMLHSIYLSAGDGTYDYLTRAKYSTKRGKGLRVHFENLTPEDLSDLAMNIKSVFENVLRFTIKLQAEGFVDIPVVKKTED